VFKRAYAARGGIAKARTGLNPKPSDPRALPGVNPAHEVSRESRKEGLSRRGQLLDNADPRRGTARWDSIY